MPELLKSLNIREVFGLSETKIDDSYPDSVFYVCNKNKKVVTLPLVVKIILSLFKVTLSWTFKLADNKDIYSYARKFLVHRKEKDEFS